MQDHKKKNLETRSKKLSYQFTLIQAIRDFFLKENFTDVLTPPIVENPGMETHIHPFQLFSKKDSCTKEKFLHTSPEFHMKELLSLGFKNIFTISYCFRDEPKSKTHREQFLMLEWYRSNVNYIKIMEDIERLIHFSINTFEKLNIPLSKEFNSLKVQRFTIQEVFKRFLNIDILDYLEVEKIKNLIKEKFSDIHLPKHDLYWDDYYFLIFLNKIEPELEKIPAVILYEFPSPLAALSTLKKDDPRVCERFELYLKGVEICNCFNELTDFKEQKARFETQRNEKKSLYNYELPEPISFYESMERGLPDSAGVALGVERLLASLLNLDDPFYK